MVVFLWYNKDAYLRNVIPSLAKALPVAGLFLLYLAVIFSVLLVVVCFTEIKSGTFNRPSCAEPGEPQTHRANGARRPINWSN